MEIVYFMIALAVISMIITTSIGIYKKYSIGESLLWGLLALILTAVFGGTQGALPMLACAVGVVVIATRMTPHDKLPKTKENNAGPNG